MKSSLITPQQSIKAANRKQEPNAKTNQNATGAKFPTKTQKRTKTKQNTLFIVYKEPLFIVYLQ